MVLNKYFTIKGGNESSRGNEGFAKLIKGDVSQKLGLKSDEMICKSSAYGENVVVKCPMTGEGLRACAELISQGIPG